MKQCPECKLYGPNDRECMLAPMGPDHRAEAEKRVQKIEAAYGFIKMNGWSFTSIGGSGFGDPLATMWMVGPTRGGVVEVWGADADCVIAVQKAIDSQKAVPA